ncbi:MAG: hypothetical protein JNM94_03525 [Phycisphaerae bacterium]|nr:hypothetical protein [Phycisphaerae bacterium]
MRSKINMAVAAMGGALFIATSSTFAVEVLVNSDITTSTTWSASNVYRLTKQIYVKNGATLTIEPGTVVASQAGVGGSLAVTRGSKIVAIGTQDEPIIFTSTNDVATWTAGDPKTGTWRAAANEWGNLTIMGKAYISDSQTAGNTKTPNANNTTPMEGLVPAFAGDPDTLYGGGNDDDDSGSLKFVSLRYGGKVVGLNNELNGLSLGGIGRETDIENVEIMNNVDDGIEVWGGTVNFKYVSIWNVGDDSFDIDQGWRGKAQFGLIVQGWSLSAAQGSGVGDNLFETDGAEGADAQPVTTGVVYNFTMIGQPLGGPSGDHATAWRDNARMQYRNCIFMDIGDRLVSFDNTDGDGGEGYGFNGTLSWPNTWTTDWNQFSPVNAPANPAAFYTAQSSGKLAQITDSVMYNNTSPTAYTEANARGVFDAANNNVNAGTAVANPTASPITSITRGPNTILNGNLVMAQVVSLDPRPANAALASVGTAPNDGFFAQAQYRGGFAANENWLCSWTAADAYGFNVPPPGGCVVVPACPADLDNSGTIDGADLGLLLGNWGGSGTGDIDGNGSVDGADLGQLLGAWGAC